MVHRSKFSTEFQKASLVKNMVTGAAIGLILIGSFLISAGEPKPEWGSYWFIKPLIMVPLSGAGGGAFFYFMNLRLTTGWQKLLGTIFGVIIFIFIMWIGTVLGLNGTHWD